MAAVKKYRLLKDLPDGAKIGDEYYQHESGDYFNKRMVNEATGYIECIDWHSWQVENNPEWFKEVIEQPTEVSKEFGFAEWASHSDWTYLPSKKLWHNEEEEENITPKTSEQLYAIFEKFKQSHTPTEQKKEEPYADLTQPNPKYSFSPSYQPKERIEVSGVGKHEYCNMPYWWQFETDEPIPDEKFPAIKQAIENCLNNE